MISFAVGNDTVSYDEQDTYKLNACCIQNAERYASRFITGVCARR